MAKTNKRQNGSSQKNKGSNQQKKKKNKAEEEEVAILPYNLDAEVNRLWLESTTTTTTTVETASEESETPQPLGVQGLLDLLIEAHPDSPAPTKRQVRAAKHVIPFCHIRPTSSTSDATTTNTKEKNNGLADDAEFCQFVQQTIEQRSNVKADKRWTEVNELTERLLAMGVILDENRKTWTLGAPVVAPDDNDDDDDDDDNNDTAAAAQNDKNKTGVACQMCGRTFGSKNQIFRHLRDPTTSCGNAILGRGDVLAEAPSATKKQEKQTQAQAFSSSSSFNNNNNTNNDPNNQKRKRTPVTPQTGATTRHEPLEACVWMGDLPLGWTKPSAGQYKHLKALVFRYCPKGVLPPRIKTVIRKGYRSKVVVPPTLPPGDQQQEATQSTPRDNTDNNNNGDGSSPKGAYLGYAILVYRDAAEANLVMDHMNGLAVKTQTVYPMGDHRQQQQSNTKSVQRLPDFVVKAKPSVAAQNRGTDPTAEVSVVSPAGVDPSMLKQLQPLPMAELRRRYLRLCGTNDKDNLNPIKIWEDASTDRDRRDLVVSAYALHYHPRRMVRHQGKTIPPNLQAQLTELLQGLRWPAENHRAGLSAERYLVLTTSSQSIFFADLRQACRVLMDWADPDYFYSGIAVTKNFVASPHIDDRDQSFQYAVSLGDFTTGGELCVEGTSDGGTLLGDEDDETLQHDPLELVNIVETHNRIARVDGRHVHWVRTWQGGDRYSLIFYDTSDRFPTSIVPSGVDLEFIK